MEVPFAWSTNNTSQHKRHALPSRYLTADPAPTVVQPLAISTLTVRRVQQCCVTALPRGVQQHSEEERGNNFVFSKSHLITLNTLNYTTSLFLNFS
jgi:hypothetical protein